MHKSLVSDAGFVLLEALIAMVIAAGAMLGLGLLHAKSSQQSQLAFQRTLATIQVNDLIDRIWVNRCDAQYRAMLIEEWDEYWSDQSIDHLNLDENQQALQKILIQRDSEVENHSSANLIQYSVKISWENSKVNTLENNNVVQQTFDYHFSLPRCISG